MRSIINQYDQGLNSYSYTPYGEDISSQCVETVENHWKFTGQFHDTEIRQYYLRARQYSPYLSRFNGYDPVYGGYTEPLTLHQYLYCLNDPVNRVDLSGEFSFNEEISVQGIGNAVNTVSNAYDTAKMVKDLAIQVTSGASLQSMLLSVSIEVGGNFLNGPGLDLMGKFGGFNFLKKFTKGSGLEVHHLVEKRFAKTLCTGSA